MIILGTYDLEESKENGKPGFKYSVVFFNSFFFGTSELNINFLDVNTLHEKFNKLKEGKEPDFLEEGWAENIEKMIENIIRSFPPNRGEIYLAPSSNTSLDILAVNVKAAYELKYSIHHIKPHIAKDYIPFGIWHDSCFSRNFQKFYNHFRTDYNNYYALHALQRSKDDGIARSRLLRTWAFSSRIHMLESMDEIVDYCITNRARLMVSANPRSIIRTATAMNRALLDFIDNHVSGNTQMCNVTKLLNLFTSASEANITRATDVSHKYHILDVDTKDPDAVDYIRELLKKTDTRVEFFTETVNGYHFLICLQQGSKELYETVKKLKDVEIKKDPLLFLGKFEPVGVIMKFTRL